MKNKLLSIGISVLVAGSAVGAVNNFTSEPVEQPKKESAKEYKQEVSDEPSLEREVEREPEVQAEEVSQEVSQPAPTTQPNSEVKVSEPTVKETPASPVQTPQPAEAQQPAPEPVINKYKIMLTESVDYPNERYADRIDRKCVHYMEDGTSRWMVSTLKINTSASCFSAGTVMSPEQYILFRTDPLPEQWR